MKAEIYYFVRLRPGKTWKTEENSSKSISIICSSNLLQLFKSHVHSHKFYGRSRTLSFDWFHLVWLFLDGIQSDDQWSVKLKKENVSKTLFLLLSFCPFSWNLRVNCYEIKSKSSHKMGFVHHKWLTFTIIIITRFVHCPYFNDGMQR